MAGKPEKDCDLIMKGGVTSGVVFPKAIEEIGRAHRLHGIGGTSAGAIAAVIAAAAEYRRQTGGGAAFAGFTAVGATADDLAQRMPGLFQPSPEFRRLYRLLTGMAGSGPGGGIGRLLRGAVAGYGWSALIGAGIAAAILAGIDIYRAAWSVWSVIVMAGWIAAGAGFGVTAAVVADVMFRLPRADFGICPGIRQPGREEMAFGDWVMATIQSVAGRAADAPLLTAGELNPHDIKVAAMTTDISSGRPYELPLRSEVHYFCPDEFRLIVPEPVVLHLEALTEGLEVFDDGRRLRPLPAAEDQPIFLIARMSLSFPGLIRPVPLYRKEGDRYIRCLFTDGGLTSNFPVHFFDAILPRRPTFGIALGDCAPTVGDRADDRVRVWRREGGEAPYPLHSTRKIGGFLWALLATAKDWQDTLQSRLPGHRERMVTILLKAEEGGLNLNMDPAVVKRIAEYGAAAGKALSAFDLNSHRIDRAVLAMPKVREVAVQARRALSHVPGGWGGGYYDILLNGQESSVAGADRDWRQEQLVPFLRDLEALNSRALGGGPDLTALPARLRLWASPGPVVPPKEE
jgi:predicted acylesterase/phospholipase RssA